MARTQQEVAAKVAELGGVIAGDSIKFPTMEAHEEFRLWRWYVREADGQLSVRK